MTDTLTDSQGKQFKLQSPEGTLTATDDGETTSVEGTWNDDEVSA